MAKGFPKYKFGEQVDFYHRTPTSQELCHGEIQIIDAYGSIEVPDEVSYDIFVNGNTLYKHIAESDIIRSY